MKRNPKNPKKRTNTRNPMKLLVISTIAVMVIVVAIVILQNKQNSQNVGSGDSTLNKDLRFEDQPTIGNLDSPVSVVEFGDYKCPACKEWIEYIFPELKKDYIDTGKISFSYINVLFHEDESLLGALAGEAVWNQDSEAFWDFSKALYKEQPERDTHDEKWLTIDKVMEVAGNTVPHIDLNQLEQDILDKKYETAVLQDEKLVSEAKVELTPSIVINGTMVEDPYDYDYIKELIERGLKE
ncbi:DsbA family protein [Neobacillus sp. LXY-4]|uniref:DsbA family protein n=1 Tax=Neobacillus sp. LXY-4 TaxID=3379826 RepID=UPI003EDF569C